MYVFLHPFVSSSSSSFLVGLSVGTNGIQVFEHADNYIPCLLSDQRTISDWTHIVVVYTNNKVSL
jgi:hypothetical protein